MKQFIPTLSDTFGYEPGAVTESGDIIMIHGRYKDWNGKFKKSFVPFGLAEGQIFREYDLMYFYDNMLFRGARNIYGRG